MENGRNDVKMFFTPGDELFESVQIDLTKLKEIENSFLGPNSGLNARLLSQKYIFFSNQITIR